MAGEAAAWIQPGHRAPRPAVHGRRCSRHRQRSASGAGHIQGAAHLLLPVSQLRFSQHDTTLRGCFCSVLISLDFFLFRY